MSGSPRRPSSSPSLEVPCPCGSDAAYVDCCLELWWNEVRQQVLDEGMFRDDREAQVDRYFVDTDRGSMPLVEADPRTTDLTKVYVRPGRLSVEVSERLERMDLYAHPRAHPNRLRGT